MGLIFLIIFTMQPQWVRHSNFGVISYQDSVSAITIDNSGNIYVTGYSLKMPYNKDYLTIKYDSLGNIIWEKRYDERKKESAKAIFVDDSGNVYVTGVSEGDYLTIKYNQDGQILWTSRFDGGDYDEPVSILVDNFGNVYVTGKSYDYVTKYDYLTIKYNPRGTLLWARRHNGSSNGNDIPSSMVVDNLGNLYVTGKVKNYNYDFVTIKYNPNGEILWIANFDMGGNEEANDIAIDDSGYVYVIGTPSYIVKYNSEGQQIWYLYTQGAYKVIAIDDSGNIYGVGNYYTIYTIKCNSQGEILWWNFYPIVSIRPATDMVLNLGNIYIFDCYYNGHDSLIIIKYNSEGTFMWAKKYSTYSFLGASTLDIPAGIVASNSGNIYIAFTGDYLGYNRGDYFVIKYNSEGEIIWTSEYSGLKNYSWDEASDIAVSNSGNIYITGRSYSGRIFSWDYATIKYNSGGDEIWVRRYGSYGDQMATAIAVDDSENVYVTGTSFRGDGVLYYDYVTIKYSPEGELKWEKRYNGEPWWINMPIDICVDNSYVYVIGINRGDYTTIKYDTQGNLLWVSMYNSGYYDEPSSICVDNSGYVYVTGKGHNNYLTIKYEPSMGEILWVREYDFGFYDEATSISSDNLGNVYVTGRSCADSLGNFDIVTIKYNSNGEEIWVSRYDGEEHSYDEASSIAVDDSGNVYVVGSSYTNSYTSSDYIIIKYDSNGQIKWVKKYHGIGSSYDAATSAFLDNYGNLYVTGRSYCLCNQTDDFATIKYNSQGQEIWIERYNGPQNSHDAPVSMVLDNFGNLYVGGTSYFSSGGSVYTLIKYNLTNIKEDFKGFPLTLNFKIYPNPFKDYALIKYNLPEDSHVNISIYNVLGQKIITLLNEKKKAGDYEMKFYPKNLSKGIYFLKIKAGNLNKIEKIIFFPL